ncbi:MAG: exosome complex exonuclease Rrp41 [Candidatus Aenigmarchaeota archaeon]|nr:exosome complex exonuclease Rrp41 [Candidatus Aenigmarchaeota archaeon]
MGKTNDNLIVDGKRLDGRAFYEMRPITMRINAVENADGSAQVAFGNTEAIVAVYGPRKLFPRFLQENDRGIMRYRYNMAPFSCTDRIRPGNSRRGIEISKTSRLAFEPAAFLDDFPTTVVDVFTEILQADGSTRVTGINAASMAMAVAGVPMRDLVAACSVGKIQGQLIVDLNGIEDNNSEADVAVAMMPTKDRLTLLQMDGVLTKDELFTLLDKARENCMRIYDMQKAAIKNSFKQNPDAEAAVEADKGEMQ